ncbi:DMT family transporter [Nonomuraea typhae]|uniref:DMT family transporter n=1 Tax=Nonomuraea typhae TaxID=2603600 RepID=A0ABW7YSR1_9ACTN
MHPISARRGAAYASIAAASWGTGGAAGSLLFTSLDPVAVSFWRHLLGAGFLLPFLLRRPLTRARGQAGHVLVVGAGMAVYQAAYFTAIAESGIALATVVTMGATPVFTALGGRLLLGERLGRAGAGAMAAAITGLVLLTDLSHAGTGAGVAWSLLSGLGYAGVTLYSRRHHGDPEATAVGGFAVAALCLLPFAPAGGIVPEFTLLSAGALLFLGAVPTALAYGLFFRSLTALKATTVSIISLGEAAGAALLGVVLFGERLTPLAWSGGLVLLGAVVVLTVHRQR